MEGVSGIFDTELQCLPYKSPRWEESRKLLTGEINAAVDGLFEGGASEVVVWDGHASGQNLSVLDIHPRARLLTGGTVSSTLELDSSYSAVIFVGQHGIDKEIEFLFAFSLGGFNHQSACHNQRKGNSGRMEAIIHEAFGNIHHTDVVFCLLLVGEHNLVQNRLVVRQIVSPSQLVFDIVGIKNCHRAGLPQSRRTICQNIAERPNDGAEVPIEGL